MVQGKKISSSKGEKKIKKIKISILSWLWVKTKPHTTELGALKDLQMILQVPKGEKKGKQVTVW